MNYTTSPGQENQKQRQQQPPPPLIVVAGLLVVSHRTMPLAAPPGLSRRTSEAAAGMK